MSNKHTIRILEPSDYSIRALCHYREIGNVVLGDDGTLSETTALVVRLKNFIGADFLQDYPRLRFIISPTTGLNHIDLNLCKERGITILSLKGETEFLDSITSTAEHAFALMLSLHRHVYAAHRSVIETMQLDRDRFVARQLSSMSLGIIGYGRIGRQMAGYAKAFGMKLFVHDPYLKDQKPLCDLPELLGSSDFVSLHADYRKENEKMIRRETFEAMRRGALFINTARGELVDESDLVEALEQGKLGGAALDVIRDEQQRKLNLHDPLIRYAKAKGNLIITPHLGGCSIDARHQTEDFMAKKFFKKVYE